MFCIKFDPVNHHISYFLMNNQYNSYLELLGGLVGLTQDLVVVDHSLLAPQQSHSWVCGVDGVHWPGSSRLCSTNTNRNKTWVYMEVKCLSSRSETSCRNSDRRLRTETHVTPRRGSGKIKFHIHFQGENRSLSLVWKTWTDKGSNIRFPIITSSFCLFS